VPETCLSRCLFSVHWSACLCRCRDGSVRGSFRILLVDKGWSSRRPASGSPCILHFRKVSVAVACGLVALFSFCTSEADDFHRGVRFHVARLHLTTATRRQHVAQSSRLTHEPKAWRILLITPRCCPCAAPSTPSPRAGGLLFPRRLSKHPPSRVVLAGSAPNRQHLSLSFPPR
jgi:hypothetical protein